MVARMRAGVWTQWLGATGLIFGLMLIPAIIAKIVLSKTVAELSGPYLAFASPAVMGLLVAWWLRKWEERGASSKRVALGWALMMALFYVGVTAAAFYSGRELQLISPNGDVSPFVFAGVMGAVGSFFGMYYVALKMILARKPSGGNATAQ